MDTLTGATFAVALVSAVRSTWSPCGWSMLSTVTPLAERRRGHRFTVTAAWYVLGALGGGVSLGLVLAGAATVLGPGPLWLGGLVCVVAAVSDSPYGPSLPIHRRQVNEDWLEHYRPCVYGSGFGWQIGAGLVTYIATSSVYALVALCLLSGSPGLALGAGATFGLVRGLAILLTLRCSNFAQLMRFHRRFEVAGPVSRAVVVVVCLASGGLLLIGSAGLGWLMLSALVVGAGAPALRRADVTAG